MKENNEENRDKLAQEVIDEMDISDLMVIAKEVIKRSYRELSDEDFNETWAEVFE